ncbi:DUF397 domain-containing protein [Actinomadura algeriensis]|uniref:DUF397 domain-containing protein n=1 Tax=Actinomadura algeriensis TaxID=1679523 RepID=UPI00178C0EB4|nr:DUF397 domain-containing protein [Actinomadura algeriensis]
MDVSGARWRKSVRSSEQGDNCVELASAPGLVAVRDSKDPDGPKLLIARGEFQRFAEVLKRL